MPVASRDQIDPRYQWDLSNIFPSDDAFLAALDAAKAYPARIAALKGTVAASPEGLLTFLKLDDEVDVALGKLANYAQRKSDEDTRVARYQDFSSQVTTLCVEIAAAGSWFSNEVLSIAPETMERFYAGEPALELYRRNLDRIFARREHVLSPAEEALLASAGEMAAQPDNIFSMLNDADLTFPNAVDSQGESHPVTHGTYIPLLMEQDRALRQSAYESLYGVYRQFRNTGAATLGAQLKQLKFFSDARRYPSTLDAALASTEVPTAVYRNLIESVHANMGAMHAYAALRKRLLGVDELRFWDLYVPVVGDVEMQFTYEEACEIILEALRPLGEEYLAIVREGLSNRWIDVYENPGKRSGAYSAGGFGMNPMILLNFQGNLDSVFTLAHEMGHSVHTYLSCHNQPSCYSNYVIFVAEVASTCNEALLMDWFLKNRAEDPHVRAYLVNHYLEMFRGTLFRQCMFAEFELKANELVARGEGVTAEALSAIYRRLNEEYFGPAAVVDDNIATEWARIPHFYYNYYVYQYSTGFASAVALSQRILTQGAPAVEDYLNFLKGGASKTPLELLKGAGVDLSTPQPVDDALQVFAGLVQELDGLTRGE